MATSGGGKIRSKRSRPSNKPYQRPKSILSKVTETVAGLVYPTWLKGMLGGGSPGDDEGDESIPPEGTAVDLDTPSTSYGSGYPPMRPVPQQRYRGEEDEGDGDIVQPSPRPGIAAYPEALPPRATPLPFASYTQPLQTSTPNENEPVVYQSAAARVRDDDADSSVSTSGCSSIQPHMDRTDYKGKLAKGHLEQYAASGRGQSSSNNNTPSRASLWSEGATTQEPRGHRHGEPKPQPAAKRPRFNASYFGTPRPESTLTPQERHQSSFYAGRTTFGGSSFYRSPASSKKYNPSPYQVHLPVKRHIRPKPAMRKAMDPDFTVTSNTAMKILNTLDRMSTPLSDAKRIPVTPTPSPFAFKPRRVAASERKRPSGPPALGLQVSSQARVIPNTLPPVSRIPPPVIAQEPGPSTSEAPRVPDPRSDRIPGSQQPVSLSQRVAPSRTSAVPPASPPTKSGGKMKTKSRNTLHYSAARDEEEEVEVPDLPNIALPISTKAMPIFNFGTLQSKSVPTNSLVTNGDHRSPLSAPEPMSKALEPRTTSFDLKKVPAAKSTPAPNRTLGIDPHSNPLMTSTPFPTSAPPAPKFEFTSPIVRESAESGFKFSVPEVKGSLVEQRGVPKKNASREQFIFSAPTMKNAEATPAESQKEGGFSFSKPSTTVRDDRGADEDTPTGGIKVPKALKAGSCLQALGMGASKPSTTASVQGTTKSSSLMDKFKPAPGSWECDTCMIRNDKTASECIACKASKLDTTTNQLPPPASAGFSLADKFKPAPGSWECEKSGSELGQENKKTTPSFGDKFKPPNGSWQCSSCWVQNKPDASKCAACETAKPGAAAESASKPSSESGKMSLAEMFKPPEGSWTCDTCMIRNKAEDLKCVACESSKPGAPSSTTNSVTQSSGFSIPQSLMPAGKLTFGSTSSNATGGTPNALSDKPSLSEMFKPETGSWECDTCMVRNKSAMTRCVACETPKPGSEPPLSAPAASTFKFGASSTSSTSATTTSLSSGGFSFGSASQPTTGGFQSTTGGLQPATGGLQPAAGGFQFGSLPSSSGKETPSSLSSSKPEAVSSTGGSLLAFLKEDRSSGNAAVAAESSISTAGDGSNPLSGGFKIQTTSAGESNGKEGAPSLFNLGGASSSTGAIDSGSVGGQLVTNNVSESKPGFQFGVKPSEGDKPTPNVNPFQNSNVTATLDAKPGFTFGATSTSDLKPAAPLSAQPPSGPAAAPTTNSGMFQFGASSNVQRAVVRPGKRKDPEPSSTSQTDAGGNGSFKPTFNFGGSDSGAPAAKFGRPTAAGEQKPGLSFGSNKATAGAPQVNATTPFQFGAKPDAAAPPADQSVPNKTLFAFGSQSQQSQVPAAKTSGFQFGAVSSSSQNAKPADKAFTFGAAAPTTQAAASPFTAPTSTPGPSFGAGSAAFGAAATTPATSGVFGAKPSAQQNSMLAFGAAAPQQNSFGSTTNAFGQGVANSAAAFGTGGVSSFGSTTPAFGAVNSAGANNSAFGSETKVAAAAPTFQFGQNNNNTPSTGAFQFGAASNPPPNQTAPVQPKGFNFSGSQAPTFNFGAAPPPANQPAFQFNAPPKQADSNPFNASAPPGGRKIKKAVRRNRKT